MCAGCDVEIYVGPKMQETPALVAMCFACAEQLAYEHGGATARHLGNTYLPRGRGDALPSDDLRNDTPER
jgi:hypothetical protein